MYTTIKIFVTVIALFAGAFANFRKATVNLIVSLCPHGTTRLPPLDGFSRDFTFEYFSKHCRENFSFIKTGQE